MKINELAHILETQAKAVSEAKIKVATLLNLNSIEFEAKDKKKFDQAVNRINKMMVSVYSGIKYKIPYIEHSDDTPLYVGGYQLKEGYDLETQITICQGILSVSLSELEKLSGLTQVLNPNKMEQVKLKKAFKDSLVEAVKNIKSASNSVKGTGQPEEEEVETE